MTALRPTAIARRATAPRTSGVLALTLAALPPAWAGNVRFDVQLAPTTPGMTQTVTGLNDSGALVGHQFSSGTKETGFVFANGALALLPVPGLQWARPTGISNNGLIVGSWLANGVLTTGFLGESGPTPIAVLPTGSVTDAYAEAIDPAGRMVLGFSQGANYRLWINTAGRLTEIAAMVGPTAINSAGQVLGKVGSSFNLHAGLYSQGRTLDLGTLGGNSSEGTGLNASGTVVGYASLQNSALAGFVSDSLGMRATRAAAGFDAFLPTNLNDAGQMVGRGLIRSGSQFVLQMAGGPDDTPVDMQSLLSATSTQPLRGMVAINGSGQIAGTCGNSQACLLTPTGTLAWASSTGGSFDDARRWDSGLGFAPNRHLDVRVAPAAAVTVLASRSAEFKSLVVGTTTQGASQATLQLAEGARLAGSAATTRIERSGILTGDGVIAGGLVNRGTLQGTAATPLHITVEGTLDNQGLVTGSGRINANLINRGSSPGVRVGAGELLTIAGTGHSGGDGSVLEVRNGGELRIEGTYTAQAGSFTRLDNATLRVSGLLNAGTVQIGFGGASIFGDLVNSLGSSNGRIIASGGSEATFWGRVVNHNEMRAAAGSHIVYFGDVSGAGSFTTQGAGAYHRFEAAYNPGSTNAAAAVQIDSVAFNDTVALDLAGTQAGSGFDQIHFGGSVLFDTGARLSLQLQGGFAPQAGQRFQLFDYRQAPDGRFNALNLPGLDAGLAWDTSDLYAGGSLAVSGVPEPATGWLLLAGAGVLLLRARQRAASAQALR